MKKSWSTALSVAALALVAAPVFGNVASVQAAGPKSGDAALSGVGYANTNGASGWPAAGVEPQTASGTSVAGIGFVAGDLTLNQVPVFDFGVHNIGSSETFSMQPVDSAFRPQKLSGNPITADTKANAGVRALVVTDSRAQMTQTAGYQVILQFSPLQSAKVNDSGQFLDAKGSATTDPTKFTYNTGTDNKPVTMSGASLQFSSASVNPSTDWNAFIGDSLDFGDKAAIYPAIYTNSGKSGPVPAGSMYTTQTRLAAKDAPAAVGTSIDEGKAQVIYRANMKTGFGTWAYDFTAPSSVTMKIPSANQQTGTWVSQLTWVLVDDPTQDHANPIISQLEQ
ncbi:WxL domain-containing protein [Schleiferilactobacillus shenzhenensis]|uniref:WxL domain-containing protein n=1 Tax=Schleiferilactobacillus shenzhenensis LY-73 TaxID=1231336 RepID=U4TP89_9LACO|nr:WxL domain-containing protein [Schleiferilactobacillus shenzhenensis]ERL63713.1 hypothetical protein L248_2253 [Schleiferilactobacillus shenzhenensis LY-73]